MRDEEYEQLAATEDRHWWQQSRLDIAAVYVERMRLARDAAILDVGCGTGGTTAMLTRYGRVTGIDLSARALGHARRKFPAGRLVQADANTVGALFRPASFDLVTCFNVLYHRWIRDDRATLAGVGRILKPGGYLLLTEAAFQILMRRHDAIGMGKRRYRLGDVRQYFDAVGLRYRWGQYFNAAAVPVAAALALRDRLLPRPLNGRAAGESALPPPPVNAVLRHYLPLEARVLGALSIPLGVTLVAVGQRETAGP